MSEKIYCGNAKIVKTQYGDLTKISLSKQDLDKMDAHMRENQSNWINLVLKEKKETQPGKPTHYLEVDNWKPSTPANTPPPPVQDESDELPF
jgi:hypothetical protein